MDKELLDSLIETITEDKGRVNTYNHFDKLLLTLTDEELDYLLDSCDEDLFLNFNLFSILSLTIPKKIKRKIKLNYIY